MPHTWNFGLRAADRSEFTKRACVPSVNTMVTSAWSALVTWCQWRLWLIPVTWATSPGNSCRIWSM